MVLMFAVFLAAATPAAQAPAPSPDSGATRMASSAAADAEKSRIRCKTYRPSGTRFDKRVCKTLSDWEREREEAREAARDIQTKPQICVTGHQYCPGGGE